MASKYLARELNVPLYRLDISSALSKWNGDSEQNLQRALATVDAEAPCVLLIDEIEKLFAVARDDGAINQRLLAQTLWWLQEHRTPVLTIMTTNDMDALPSELHRAGRIDETITIEKLDQVGAFALAKKTLDRFVKPSTDQVHQLRSAVTSGLSKKDKRIAHADVVGLVIALVKRQQWVPIPTSKKEKGSS
jgi:SpoVK/Ycf46/Vps4 family AAA+-type ATPase